MDRARQFFLLVVVLVAGAAVLVLELAAGRLFAPWFGMSLPVWTNVLAVVLGALAAGYALGGRMAARGASLGTAGAVLAAAGLLTGAGAWFGPALARSLLPSGVDLEGLSSVLAKGSFLATLVVFGPPMVLLGTVGPLAVHLLAEGGAPSPAVMPGPGVPAGSGQAAGRVLAVSTLGSIAGTFLTTYALLPELGTRRTIGAAGAALAVCGFALFLVRGGGGRARAAAAAAAVAALGLAASGPGGEFRPAEPGTGRVLADVDSAYQFLQVREVEDARPGEESAVARFLTMNEGVLTYHSVLRRPSKGETSFLTGGRYYDVYPALPLLCPADPGKPLDVLILGSAAGTQARALRHFVGEERDLRVDGVEIDPAVLALGREHFDLPSAPWLRLHAADARAFLEAAPADRKWDLVLVDCYSQEYYVPFHVATEEFFRGVRAHLKPGGVLAFNAFSYRPDALLLRTLVNTAATAFGRAWLLPIPGYSNYVVLASAREADLPLLAFGEAAARAAKDPSKAPASWGGFAARPEADAVLRLAAACCAAASPFQPDPAGVVLTDDRAPVERLMDRQIADFDRERSGDR
jgi:spermidine synthase